jgi:hypothetical protein
MNNFYHYFAGFVILLGLFYLKIEHKFRWFVAFFIGVLKQAFAKIATPRYEGLLGSSL